MSLVRVIWNPMKGDDAELANAVSTAFATGVEVRWWETSADDPGQAMVVEGLHARKPDRK